MYSGLEIRNLACTTRNVAAVTRDRFTKLPCVHGFIPETDPTGLVVLLRSHASVRHMTRKIFALVDTRAELNLDFLPERAQGRYKRRNEYNTNL